MSESNVGSENEIAGLEFGDFLLDLDTATLQRDSQPIHLRPQTYEVLLYLLNHDNQLVSKNDMIQSVWRGAAVGDDSVTQCIKEIRKALDDRAQSFIRTVPRRGYIFSVPVSARPRETRRRRTDGPRAAVETANDSPVLENRKTDGAGDPSEPATNGDRSATAHATTRDIATTSNMASRVYPPIAIALLGLILGFYLLTTFVQNGQTTKGAISVAVLPLRNLGDDVEQSYFADGITVELSNLLGRVDGLRVPSSNSTLYFKDREYTIPELAAQLDVSHVIVGSVQRDGDRVRLTLQLVDARTESQLWNETFDEPFVDVLGLQDRIAQLVIGELSIQLTGEVPLTEKIDPEAWALFSRARYLLNQRDPAKYQRADRLLDQALALEPDFVNAISEKARAIRLLGEGTDEFLARVDRLFEIDPQSPHGLAWMVWVTMLDGDFESSARYIERAAATNSPVALIALVLPLDLLGYPEQAITVGENVIADDPLCAQCLNHLGLAYLGAGRHEDAERMLRRAVDISPSNYFLNSLGRVLLVGGRAREALAVFDSMRPINHPGRVMALHDLGLVDERNAEMEILWTVPSQSNHHDVSAIYAWLGKNDKAFQWLEEGLADDKFPPSYLKDPRYRSLHDDPRWVSILEPYGLAPHQLAALDIRVALPPARSNVASD